MRIDTKSGLSGIAEQFIFIYSSWFEEVQCREGAHVEIRDSGGLVPRNTGHACVTIAMGGLKGLPHYRPPGDRPNLVMQSPCRHTSHCLRSKHSEAVHTDRGGGPCYHGLSPATNQPPEPAQIKHSMSRNLQTQVAKKDIPSATIITITTCSRSTVASSLDNLWSHCRQTW